MKHLNSLLRAVLLVAVAFSPAASALAQENPPPPAPAWQTFTPESKVFTAEFPGTPAYNPMPVDYGFFKTTQHRYALNRLDRGGPVMEVGYMDAPPTDGPLDPTVLLDATIDTVMKPLKQQGGQETPRKEANADGCVGREYGATISNQAFLRGRVFIAGERIFNVFYVSPMALPNHQQNSLRFLNSFHITGGCAPVKIVEPAPAAEKKTATIRGTPDAATGWVLITSERDEFSILMPKAAEFEEEPAQQKPFPLMMRSYASDDDAGAYIAAIGGDFPPEVQRIENFGEVQLNIAYRTLEAEAEKLGAKLVAERDVMVGSHRGRQYRLDMPAMLGRAQIFSTKKRFYFFIAFVTSGGQSRAKLDRFFSSIKISAQ